MEFRTVVWNLKGLSLTSESSRLQRARKAFSTLANNNETAAFALVELGPEPNSILEDLANYLGDGWMHYFGAVRGGKREIGLLLQTKRLSATTLRLSTSPHDYSTGVDIKIGRIPAALFLVHRNNRPVFLLAVVHFKAEKGGSEHYTRKSLAAWLRIELERFYSKLSLPVVIVGDFNGEPCEAMFGPEGFRAFRRIDSTLRSSDSLQLYNPMWRLLPDSFTVTAHRANNGQVDTPHGTFLDEIWHSLIDGVLVSGEWLENQKYILHNERLEILTDDLWHHIGSQGAHHAYPAGMGKELAITDHLPIAVNLEIL